MQRIIQFKVLSAIVLSLLASCGNEMNNEHAGHEQQKVQETGNNAVPYLEGEALLIPTNEFAISSVTAIPIEHKEEELELKVFGSVAYDTRQAGSISSKVKGRIEKLYIRYKYQPVSKGQHVMDIYSPELMTAQQNLIFLLKNDPNNTSLINAAKERLFLLGMTSVQVSEVALSKKTKIFCCCL